MTSHEEFHRRSIEDPEGFWGELSAMIDWHKPPQKVLQYDNPPFSKWFVGGETNICYNAVDRHLATRPDQAALVYISTEVNETTSYTYANCIAKSTAAPQCCKNWASGKATG